MSPSPIPALLVEADSGVLTSYGATRDRFILALADLEAGRDVSERGTDELCGQSEVAAGLNEERGEVTTGS